MNKNSHDQMIMFGVFSNMILLISLTQLHQSAHAIHFMSRFGDGFANNVTAASDNFSYHEETPLQDNSTWASGQNNSTWSNVWCHVKDPQDWYQYNSTGTTYYESKKAGMMSCSCSLGEWNCDV